MKDVCHRELEFAEVVQGINTKLSKVYSELSDSKYQSVLLTSSGTGAVEAMLSTFIPKDSITLVIDNGVYGARMERMLELSNRRHKILKFDWKKQIDVDLIDKKLKESKSVRHTLTEENSTLKNQGPKMGPKKAPQALRWLENGA